MFCAKCGKENHDGARFCKHCGEPLESMMEKKSTDGMKPSAEMRENDAGESGGNHGKKKIIITCAAIAVIVACVIGIIAYLGSQKDAEYNAKMEEANQYLQALNYEKAETAYLDAIDIEPKRAEAYLELSDVYIVQEEYEEALAILEKGQNKTNNIESFEKKIKSVKEQAKADPKSAQYQAYYDLVMEHQDKYGEAGYDELWEENTGNLTGLCIVKLFDFNKDGNEELIIGYYYQTEGGWDSFDYEVWAWKDGKLVNVLPAVSLAQTGIVGGSVITAVKDKSIYLLVASTYKTGSEEDEENYMLNNQTEYMQYDSGEFITKHKSIIAENEWKKQYTVDDRTVKTQEEYRQLMGELPKAKKHKLYEETAFFEKENGELEMVVIGNHQYLRSIIDETERNIELLRGATEENAVSKDSPEPSDSTITIDELTDGYWENNIQAPYVFKFNEDGTMEAYGLEPYDYYQMKENGGGIEEDKLHFSHEAAYSFKDSKLIITHDDGSRTELEIVTKDAPIEWDTGLSNQLGEIPDGEMFFYETGYDGWDDIPDNAMYLVKREQ